MANKANVQEKFYDNEKYSKTEELVRKHATGYCIDQIKLPKGGVLEKWQIGNEIVVILCERTGYKNNEQFRVEVLRPVSTGIMWDELDKALAEIAAKSKRKE